MQITRWPKGGLNLDDSIELMDPDDWSYAANIVDGRAYTAKSGEKESIRGTTAIVTTVDLAGSQHIGTIKSAEDDVSYLFYYNAIATKNCIVKFNNGVITPVLIWSGLNFSPLKAHRINGGGIADDMLYFTDNYNQPRCIHLTRYSDGVTVPSSEEEILHIRRGPQFAPDFDVVTAVGKKSVQFAYQYEYEDGQLSVISPWTYLRRDIESVTISIPLNETIPALVKRARFIAREGNDGVPAYIGDLQAPLSPATTVAYTGQNHGVVPDSYLKTAELVPLLAKSACISKGRAWFANFTEGYDTPDPSTITLTYALEDTLVQTGKTFGKFAKFNLGVVFFDNQGRSCGVIDGGWSLTTPADLDSLAFTKRLKYRITGTPPAWATSYALVMTKDHNKTWFIEGSAVITVTTFTAYVKVVDATGAETYDNTFDDDVRYVRLPLYYFNSRGLYYAYKAGDKIRIKCPNGNLGPFEIAMIKDNHIYIERVDLGDLSAGAHIRFQIYTPKTTPNEIYYELGDRRPVVAGAMDTIDYYIEGDCVSYNIAEGTSFADTWRPQISSTPMLNVWDTDAGKPFIKTNIGQVTKKGFIRFSSPFIAGINVNGLSEFNSGDENNVPIEAVQVQKLQPTTKEGSDGEVILAICNSDTYSVYVDEARMSTQDGQSLVIGTTDVIGDIRKQNSGFGTLHPESVIEDGGQVWWWDQLARSYVRYATNGIFPVSEYKCANHFEMQAELNDSSDLVVSGIDPFHKMVMVTFVNAETTTKKTIGFSMTKNRWISFFDFAPETYIIGSKKMFSAIAGVVYSHDDAVNFNRFYGVDYTSKLKLTMNDSPDEPKEWKVMQLQLSNNFFTWSGGNQTVADVGLRVDITNRHGQETSILYNEFEVDENMAYAEIRGDENTGGVLDGNPIYSNTIQAEITFSGGSYKQLLIVKAGFQPSRGHEI